MRWQRRVLDKDDRPDHVSLIYGNAWGPPFEVGTSTLVIATSGRLYMGVNDSSPSNNSGSWKVDIKIGGPPL